MTLSAAQRISCDVVETRVDVARIFNIQRYSLNAGYSAFFVELSKEIQDDIIRRTAHQL